MSAAWSWGRSGDYRGTSVTEHRMPGHGAAAIEWDETAAVQHRGGAALTRG